MNVGSKLKLARNVVTSKAGRSLLKTQKHSPHILFAFGVVGFVATTVLASKATLELDELLDEHDRDKDRVHLALEEVRVDPANSQYSERAAKKDLAILKTKVTKDVAKLYAPAIIVGTLSIAALGGSHVILTKRNSAIMAAYATLQEAFTQYRVRVRDEYGDEVDKKMMFGSQTRQIVEDGPDGPIVKDITTYAGTSQYAREFSKDTSDSWEPRPEHNFFMLKARQQYANDMLHVRGHVTLNEVYDWLGLTRTKQGFVVGWVKNNPRGGDNFIDFGVSDNDRLADFVSGRDGAILLDFNVDGVIYDLI